MSRAEIDPPETPAPTMGAAEAVFAEEDHAAHTFLYVPDLAERTGWNTHRVPEREPERVDKRLGFRR